ncbi:MAG: FkbM family methyltransferase [Bryobacterales bacterium]|nr:FkbM family methyltransferase [Bryobacterales bacterium]
MTTLARHLLKLRPAALASVVATLCGLNKRRMVSTPNGTFFINPVSNFGAAILDGDYEPRMKMVLDTYLPSNGVFIDIGANEGYFSVLASRCVGAQGIVVAIEPQSRLQPVIQANLDINRCHNVRLLKCLVSGKTGEMNLSLSPDVNTGASTLFRQTKYSLPTERVESVTMADLFVRAKVDHCDLMKVDIEGAEYDVFMEAGEVLCKGIIRHLALEFHESILESRGLRAAVLHDFIIRSGYRVNRDLGPSVYSFCAG